MKPTLTMVLGIEASREDHHFLIASGDIVKIVDVRCGTPPPWAQPWIGGLAWVDANLVVVVDPMGLLALEAINSPQLVTIVVMRAQPYRSQWAMVVDAVDHNNEKAYVANVLKVGTNEQQKSAITTGHSQTVPINWHCPTEWFSTVIDENGNSLPLLDINVISDSVTTRYRSGNVA